MAVDHNLVALAVAVESVCRTGFLHTGVGEEVARYLSGASFLHYVPEAI